MRQVNSSCQRETDLLEMWQCHNEDEWEENLWSFCCFIDIWIMDSVLNNDFRILAIVFWITAIVNQYWTVANLNNDCQLIKGAPFCGKTTRFWKNVTDSSWRWIQGSKNLNIYLLCFSRSDHKFLFCYYSELTFSIYIIIYLDVRVDNARVCAKYW